mmetsp:Transcript_18172/g.50884  ORF Transcript_18172/g.50884 Transcript_18172/m.50884 type:complete len:297 (-) Transcript_18172:195-1085(-)
MPRFTSKKFFITSFALSFNGVSGCGSKFASLCVMAKSEGGQKLQALARSAAAWWTSCTAWLEFEAAGTEAGAAAAADDAGNAVPRRAWMSAMHRLSWIRKLEASATPCTAKLLALMRASFLSNKAHTATCAAATPGGSFGPQAGTRLTRCIVAKATSSNLLKSCGIGTPNLRLAMSTYAVQAAASTAGCQNSSPSRPRQASSPFAARSPCCCCCCCHCCASARLPIFLSATSQMVMRPSTKRSQNSPPCSCGLQPSQCVAKYMSWMRRVLARSFECKPVHRMASSGDSVDGSSDPL